jgi:hypothetical protein
MPIPAGTKFHGVAPSVDTTNRGSVVANSNRDAYAIEEIATEPFQYSSGLPAIATLTFSGLPANGETLTIGGTVITFRTALTGSGNEIKIQSSVGQQSRRIVNFFGNDKLAGTLFYNIESEFSVIALEAPTDDSVINLIAKTAGTSGNSISVATTIANATLSGATLLGGTNSAASVSSLKNVYVNAVAAESISHSVIVYQIGVDQTTGLPLVTDNPGVARGLNANTDSNTYTPMGVAYDKKVVDGTSSGFSTISQGETFKICSNGIVPKAIVYTDAATGARPPAGSTLTAGVTGDILSPDSGSGQSIATMIIPGTDSSFVQDAVVYVSGGVEDSYLRPTRDGVSNQSTVRLPAVGNAGVTAGSLVVHAGNTSSDTGNGVGFVSNVRHYTNTDANLDILGISSATVSGSSTDDGMGVCVHGLVNATVYDASGNVLTSETAGLLSSVVYAGDGTTNASHLLTTDTTSGVAVGIIYGYPIRGAAEVNKFSILFQPYRL